MVILALNFTKSYCLVLLKPVETSLMLWLYGNDFINRATLSGSCRHTSKNNWRGRAWGRLISVCTKLEPARSESNEILEINVLQKFGRHVLLDFSVTQISKLKSLLSVLMPMVRLELATPRL